MTFINQQEKRIIIKNQDQIKKIKVASQIIAKLFEELESKVIEGVSTLELDKFAEDFIRSNNATPAFKGYLGFPSALCTSVNEQVIHGIPSKYRLKKGDIISIDVGVNYQGYLSDASYTYPVGEIEAETQKLLNVTHKSLYLAIEKAKPGFRVGDVSYAVQSYVEANGYSVIRDYYGHGVGVELWESPVIPNYGEAGYGDRFYPGMVIAIEPMVVMGSYEIEVLKDGWTVVPLDKSLSAHYEHTILITETGNEILTKHKLD